MTSELEIKKLIDNFYEINIFGNIAHVYSEYKAKKSLADSEPIKKGINLVQLINDGQRWKILNMLWQDK